MKILFISVLSILINTIHYDNISVRDDFVILKDVNLNNKPAELYMVGSSCSDIYLCKSYEEEERLFGAYTKAHLSNCYLRTGSVTKDFYPSDMTNPYKCKINGEVTLKAGQCYLTSNGKEQTYNFKNDYPGVRYYDVDWNNKKVLTIFGWCSFYGVYDIDANWMSSIDENLSLNQINIPGTHDSGTFDISVLTTNGFLEEVAKRSPAALTVSEIMQDLGQTQDLDISEQLNSGIRYLDVRLATNNDQPDKLYLSHGDTIPVIETLPCMNTKKGGYLYFDDVINECVYFLSNHRKETIILHLAEERIVQKTTDNYSLGQLITKSTVLNILYSNYFYIGDKIPKLKDAQNKIVIVTRKGPYEYKDSAGNKQSLGIKLSVPGMGGCKDYPEDGNQCYPVISGNNRFQDAYNLDAIDKWEIVEDVLNLKVNHNNTIGDALGGDDSDVKKFNDISNEKVLTLNFMNVARNLAFIRAAVDKASKYINDHLTVYINAKEKSILENENKNKNDLKKSLHNEWVILNYPSPDIIRKIYQSNDFKNSNFTMNKIELDSVSKWTTLDYYLSKWIPLIYKRDNNIDDVKACLQRKIVIDEQGNQNDYKCVENNLNRWYIKQNVQGKFYSIVSAYDGKCLNYSNDKLYMEKCEYDNEKQGFSIKDGKICSRLDESQCLDGNYDIDPVPLKSKKYDNLTCSITFARLGVKCCSNKNTKVEYVDEIGNWGVENGKLCGIGYERCSFSVLGFNCCSSVNPEVVSTDEYGSWGIEDSEWCGIGEAVYDTRVRIKNGKTQECLITNLHSDTNVLLMGDCNHSMDL